MSRSVVIVAAFALIACTKKAPPVVERDAGGAVSSIAPSAASAPRKRPVTTSWGIAGGNLDRAASDRDARAGLGGSHDHDLAVRAILDERVDRDRGDADDEDADPDLAGALHGADPRTKGRSSAWLEDPHVP